MPASKPHGTRKIGATRELDPRLGACSREAGKSGERELQAASGQGLDFLEKNRRHTDSLAGKRRREPAFFVTPSRFQAGVWLIKGGIPFRSSRGLEGAPLVCRRWCRVERGLGKVPES